MGQYYVIVNLDKKQFLHPHRFGDGLKLREFGASGEGTMMGLSVLLSDGNGRGGGDLPSDNPIIGSWARDRIVVAGDYADAEPAGEGEEGVNLFSLTHGDGWKDVSEQVLMALSDDMHTAVSLHENLSRFFGSRLTPAVMAKIEASAARVKPGHEEEPPHVMLAKAVLRNSDEPAAWHALADACVDRAQRPAGKE